MILYSEGDTRGQEADAETVLGILCAAYPNHPWAVRVTGGVIFIRYIMLGTNKPWGMIVKFSDVSHDAAVFKREIVMKAGEWLERAGLVRGRGDGSVIARVDGLPERDQPCRDSILPKAALGTAAQETPSG